MAGAWKDAQRFGASCSRKNQLLFLWVGAAEKSKSFGV
jgi:hypothetical protein